MSELTLCKLIEHIKDRTGNKHVGNRQRSFICNLRAAHQRVPRLLMTGLCTLQLHTVQLIIKNTARLNHEVPNTQVYFSIELKIDKGVALTWTCVNKNIKTKCFSLLAPQTFPVVWIWEKKGEPHRKSPPPSSKPTPKSYLPQSCAISQSVNPPLEFQKGRRGSKLWDTECKGGKKDKKIVSTLQETLTLCSAQIHDIQKSLCESCSETCSCLSSFNESKALGGIVRTPRLNWSQPPGKQSSSAAHSVRHAAVYFDRWVSSPALHLLWHHANV